MTLESLTQLNKTLTPKLPQMSLKGVEFGS